jgi:hypothetical protein
MKRKCDEALGRCVSTGSSATSMAVSLAPTQTPVTAKHHRDKGLGECISEASTALSYVVPSTSYRRLPGSKMTLKTSVLGVALPPMPDISGNTPSISKLGPAESPTESNKSGSPGESPRKRPRVSHCHIQYIVLIEILSV